MVRMQKSASSNGIVANIIVGKLSFGKRSKTHNFKQGREADMSSMSKNPHQKSPSVKSTFISKGSTKQRWSSVDPLQKIIKKERHLDWSKELHNTSVKSNRKYIRARQPKASWQIATTHLDSERLNGLSGVTEQQKKKKLTARLGNVNTRRHGASVICSGVDDISYPALSLQQ